MKKTVALILVFVFLGVSAISSNKYELEMVDYPIYFNGELSEDSELPTLSYNDRTYVPLRMVAENSGLSVYFDENDQTVHVYNSDLYNNRYYFGMYRVYSSIHEAFASTESVTNMLENATKGQLSDVFLGQADQSIKLLRESVEQNNSNVQLMQDAGLYLSDGFIADDYPLKKEALDNVLIILEEMQELTRNYLSGVHTQAYWIDEFYKNSNSILEYRKELQPQINNATTYYATKIYGGETTQ